MNSLAISVLVKSSLLIGIAFAINRLVLHRRSAASRHLVWMLALGGVLALPFLQTAVPDWEIEVRVAAEAQAPSTAPVVDTETTADPTPSSVDAMAAVAEPRVEASSEVPAPPAAAREMTWTSLALSIYAIGVLLLGLKLGADRLALRRLVRESAEVTDPSWRGLLHECETRMGLTEPVRLLRSLDRSMPMAFGVRRPTILIPAIADTWPEDRKRAVLLHELAHIERRDCLTQLIASLTCAAYWMHPGVWWVARRLRVEREIACDDRVLSAGTLARDYAGHLLELAYSLGGFRSPALVVSMARPRQLEGRMLAVLDAARNRVTPTLRARMIGLIATAALVVPLAAAEAVVVADSSEEPRMAVDAEPVPEPLPAPEPGPQASEKAQPAPAAAAEERRERRRREVELPGTWEARLLEDSKGVYLRLSERRHSNYGFDLKFEEFEGLNASTFSGSGSAKFSLRREAGTIAFEGSFRSGVGAGTFDFTPNQAFPAEMTRRGFAAPTATEQYLLARGNVGVAFLDELNAQKYEKPSLDDLVRAADHGVHLDYLKGMGAGGYRLGQLSSLIRTRDHGVTPEYARTMADEGFKNLTADELVRARDHGVDPRYVKVMRAFGYVDVPLNDVIRARDHGVDEDYMRGMMAASPERLSLSQLVRARDHGVTPDFVKAMREAGYGDASIEELVRARDHGVGGDYAKGMLSLGLVRPSLEELVKARDHGVTPEYVKAFVDLGYKPSLDDMVRGRDHGVEAEFAKSLNSLGYERLPIDDLVRLRDHGVSASFVRDQNATPRGKLTVDELVRRRDRM
jgi:beta-lactamase regulating signal transducer with metallopeptidase domain